MWLRPPRTVRVTTEQDLDLALESADQVIVEGDDRLLSYAVAKASKEPANRIEAAAPLDSPSLDAHPRITRTRYLLPLLMLAGIDLLVLAGIVGIGTIIWWPVGVWAPALIPPSPSVPSIGTTHPWSSIGPLSAPSLLQALVWPVVFIVAILALFLIAQAIMGGRNVEISWKVTSKVTGRVVITKVQRRAAKVSGAA